MGGATSAVSAFIFCFFSSIACFQESKVCARGSGGATFISKPSSDPVAGLGAGAGGAGVVGAVVVESAVVEAVLSSFSL